MPSLDNIARDPLAWLMGLLTGIFGLLHGNIVASLWAAIWASSGDLFTLVSLGFLTIPPHIPPQSGADWAVLAVGAIFLAKVGERVLTRFDERL